MKIFKKIVIFLFLISLNIGFVNPDSQSDLQSEILESEILDNFSYYDNLANLKFMIQSNLTKLKNSIFSELDNLNKKEIEEIEQTRRIDLGEFAKTYDIVFQSLNNINWKFEQNVLEQIEVINSLVLEYLKQSDSASVPLDIEVLKSLENLVKEYVKQSNTFWQRLSVAGKIWQKGPEFLTWRLWHNFDQVSSWKKFENLIITTSVFPFKLAYKSILKISKCIFNVTKRATSTAYEKVVSKKIFKLIMLYVALCAAEVAFEYKHVNDIRFSDIQHLDLEKLKAFCEKIYLGFGNGSNNLFLKKNFEKLITRLSHPNFKNVHEAFAPYFKKIYNAIYGLITGHEPVGCKSKACEQIESLKSWFISDTSFVKIAVMYMIFKDMVL